MEEETTGERRKRRSQRTEKEKPTIEALEVFCQLGEKLGADPIRMKIYCNASQSPARVWQLIQAILDKLSDDVLYQICDAADDANAIQIRRQATAAQYMVKADTAKPEKKEASIHESGQLLMRYQQWKARQRMKKRYKQLQEILVSPFNPEQLQEIRKGYEAGLSIAEIKQYARPGANAKRMAAAREVLEALTRQNDTGGKNGL